jgi:hypothetical protein
MQKIGILAQLCTSQIRLEGVAETSIWDRPASPSPENLHLTRWINCSVMHCWLCTPESTSPGMK